VLLNKRECFIDSSSIGEGAGHDTVQVLEEALVRRGLACHVMEEGVPRSGSDEPIAVCI
jgi:hypothetical protein